MKTRNVTQFSRGLALTALALTLSAACGDDGGSHNSVSAEQAPTTSAPPAAGYAVYRGSGWDLVDADTEVPDPPVSLLEDGAWRAEYVRNVHDGELIDADEVAVGGFQVDIRTAEEELGRNGTVTFSDASLSPWSGVIASYQEDGDSPLIALLEADSTTTVTALTYDLTEGELVEWVRGLDPATEQRWLDHAGLN